jgi:hypothetical protein
VIIMNTKAKFGDRTDAVYREVIKERQEYEEIKDSLIKQAIIPGNGGIIFASKSTLYLWKPEIPKPIKILHDRKGIRYIGMVNYGQDFIYLDYDNQLKTIYKNHPLNFSLDTKLSKNGIECFHEYDGVFFVGAGNTIWKENTKNSNMSSKTISSNFRKRNNTIKGLKSLGPHLFDFGEYGIYEAISNTQISPEPTTDITFQNRKLIRVDLHEADDQKISEVCEILELTDFNFPIFEDGFPCVDRSILASRNHNVSSVCMHENILYDAGKKLYETQKDPLGENPLLDTEIYASSMINIPERNFQEMLKFILNGEKK